MADQAPTRSKLALPVSLVLLLCPLRAGAVVQSAAVPTFLDASVASTGRGRASTAVFWEDGPNYWANPALLAYHRGIRFERSRTRLVPDLTEGVFYRTNRWSFGAFGVGIATSGRPVDGVGNQRVDYGESQATDASGVTIASFDSWEEIHLLAAGASVGEVLSSFVPQAQLGGLPLVRFADLAGGFASKEFVSNLSPVIQGLQTGQGETETRDWGFLARVTPIDTAHPWFDPGVGEVLPLRVDVAYGRATLNYDDATISYGSTQYPIARMPRRAWSTHAALAVPAGFRRGLGRSGLGWLADFLDPLVQWGHGWDRYRAAVKDPATGAETEDRLDLEESGWELTIANVFTLRRGHIDDPLGDIVGDTSGWGAGFRAGRYGGFRYDEATRPQATGLADVDREGFSVWIDPLAIGSALRRR